MKDLFNFLLNDNIQVQNNISEKRLYNLTILAIDYYWPI